MRDAMRFFLAVLFLIIATTAQATVGPMVFLPAAPNSNNSFNVSVATGPCEVFIRGGITETQVTGSVIKITSLGISNSNIVLCFFPISTASFNVGPVPAGTYTVELYLRHSNLPTLVELVQTGSVNVTQGEVVLTPVPINSLSGILFLSILIICTGIINTRRF